jgi:CDP-diacylglycerol---glycerol-3-phosphate 3-phosphatidyltransferase
MLAAMDEAAAAGRRAVAARRAMVVTGPNAISVVRVLLVPVVMALALASFDNHERWAAAAYFAAAASDSLDGWLARRGGSITTIGVFLDPLADKLLVIGTLVALVQIDRVSAWVAMAIVAREFAISGLRMVAATGSDVIAAAWPGKLKTVVQNVAVLVLLLASDPGALWVNAVVAVAVALTLGSLADYFWRARRHFIGGPE